MDKYQIKQMIGSGTYSEVFRAINKNNNQTVAIKVMKKPYKQHKNVQDLELNSLKKFASNPCVIEVKEILVEKGILNIVFELLDMNLIDYYKELKKRQNRGMKEEEIKLVMFQMALALRDIHQAGFAHRDIKPENMLVCLKKQGFLVDQIKLVDFGLTKKLDRNKNTNYIATRWYRSPELLLGMNYNQGVDIFALGCVMIEMYLGYEAFQGKNTIDQLNKELVVLGTPSQNDWQQGYRAFIKNNIQLPHYQKISIKDNIPGTSNQAANLIQNMIRCNPQNRISIQEVLSHPYFNSVRSKLPEKVKRYINKASGDTAKYGTATTAHDIVEIKPSNGIINPMYQYQLRPTSNLQNHNTSMNSGQKRPISSYTIQQKRQSPYSSQQNISFKYQSNPYQPSPYKLIQSPSKMAPKLDIKTQKQINNIASHLYSHPSSPLKQPYFNKLSQNSFNSLSRPKLKQQFARSRPHHLNQIVVNPIGVNINKRKFKRSGIHLTDKNVKKISSQGGCMNFILGKQEEIVLQYNHRGI